MEHFIFTNARIVLPDTILDDHYLSVKNGVIESIGKGTPDREQLNSCTTVDCGGQYLSPGFIDIHCHGGGGADFMDGHMEDILTAARAHLIHGTTGICPTTLTCSDEELFTFFESFRQAREVTEQMPHLLGIHLEGPYFAYSQRGAQDPANLKQPVPEHYMKILEASGDIVRWSIAPELPGALELGRLLKSRHILPSVGHTDAVCEEVTEAFESGYSLMTHLYSGMQGVTRRNAYRYAGAVEAAFLIDGMDVEIIADGIHLPKSLLQLIYKFKGADRIALITDSMRAAGMPEGTYKLGSLKEGQTVVVEDGVAKLPDRTAFAGSVATADRLVRTMVETAGVPLAEAVRMMTATPARILGVNDRKGSLQVGKDADIILFDDHIRVARTLIGGKTVAIFDRIV